ncbi:uncharacterized protein OCT59_008782 [Rhizophagus irregularis]|uniref:Uncharacterized protein n=2 Tax=Rhizophagus irregularis TaxID=588596 RepID=A0A015J9D9_RHIIW|nr:hypothetical protein RirG_151740 [Rhizophagus irregularis DAOM 197198w]UZO17426.1 hypothetical protein OCT59_008782 [Rhizophagus irregularis]GBC24050.1 hypothetical protein RIR_jg412.t1 [Rhizophagus irregularis DAOM 181602=DAOM 197198]CAB5143891.1 unnamed protein product [Rhizophagus irregularis]
MKNLKITRKKTVTLWSKILIKMVTLIKMEWWLPKCELTIQWEVSQGIDRMKSSNNGSSSSKKPTAVNNRNIHNLDDIEVYEGLTNG